CFSVFLFFFSSRRRHTRFSRDWSSDVCSSDLLQTTMEPFVLLRQQDEHLLGRVQIIDLFDVGHDLQKARSRSHGKIFFGQWIRAYAKASDEVAPFEKQLELAALEHELFVPRPAPELRELPSLEPLGVHTQTRAIEQQHLRMRPTAIREQEQRTAEWVEAHVVAHDPCESLEALPHVDGLAERIDLCRAEFADYRTSRASTTRSASVSPRTRIPEGRIAVNRLGSGSSLGSGTSSTISPLRAHIGALGLRRPSQFQRLACLISRASARDVTVPPAARHRSANATTSARICFEKM